jgi:hypothetical protein
VIIRDDSWHKQTYDRIKLNRNNRDYTSGIGNIDCIDVAEEREREREVACFCKKGNELSGSIKCGK